MSIDKILDVILYMLMIFAFFAVGYAMHKAGHGYKELLEDGSKNKN